MRTNPRHAVLLLLLAAAAVALASAGVPGISIDTNQVLDGGSASTTSANTASSSRDGGGAPRCDAADANDPMDVKAAQCSDPAWLAGPCGQTAVAASNCAQVQLAVGTLYGAVGTTQSIATDETALIPTSKSAHVSAPALSLVNPKSWAGWEVRARQEAAAAAQVIGLPGVGPSAATYTRKPAWSSNGPAHDGQGVDSCEEYVYESFYDIERWIDASNFCARNDRCAVDMTFFSWDGTTTPTRPGIAGRVLRDRFGTSLGAAFGWDYPNWLDGSIPMAMAKNDYYAGMAAYLSPAMRDAFVAQGQGAYYDALELRLRQGALYYGVKTNPATTGGAFVQGRNLQQGFKSLWEYHYVMKERTKSLPAEVLEEFRLRRGKLLEVQQGFEDLTGCTTFGQIASLACNGGGALTKPTIQPAFDGAIWMYDVDTRRALRSGGLALTTIALPPTTQFAIAHNFSFAGMSQTFMAEQMNRTNLAMGSPLANQGLLSAFNLGSAYLQGFATNQVNTAPSPVPSPGSTSLTYGSFVQLPPGSPAVVKSNADAEFLWQTKVFPLRIENGLPVLNCEADDPLPVTSDPTDRPAEQDLRVTLKRQALCKLTNQILREYNHAERAEPSCLDPNSYACDWTPFEARSSIETNYLTKWSRQKESRYNFCRMMTGGGQLDPSVPSNQANLTLTAAERSSVPAVNIKLKGRYDAVSEQLKAIPRKGTNVFGKTFGDKQTYGTDLFNAHYDFTLGWEARLYPMKNDATQICQVGGMVGGNASAGITVFGGTCELFDVELQLRANDSEAGTNDEKAHVLAHANVLGFGTPGNMSWTYELFEPIDETWDLNSSFGFQASNDESIDLFRADFQIWYFTVTIRVGIGVRYGGFGEFATKVPNDCAANVAPSPVMFEATAKVGPYVALYAIADIGVSLAHIIGVGVEVELTILSVSVPIHTAARITNKNNAMWFEAEAGLDLDVGTLDGKLKGYIEIFGGKIKKEIVAWKGYHQIIPVFQTPTAAVPFGTLGVAGTLPTVGAEQPPAYYANY